jgi:hypothetical protein
MLDPDVGQTHGIGFVDPNLVSAQQLMNARPLP